MSIRRTERERPPGLAVFRTDLARFTSAGHGTLHDPRAVQLQVGQRLAVTDDGADTVEAEVLAVRDGAADIRLHWDQIVERA